MDPTAWNARYAGSELVWSAEPNRFLPQEAAGLTVGRAIDLACGEGRNAIWLARQGWEVVGVDFADAGIDKARRLASDAGVAVEWVVADVTRTTRRAPSTWSSCSTCSYRTSNGERRWDWLPAPWQRTERCSSSAITSTTWSTATADRRVGACSTIPS